jgi:hypothetical protein
VKRYVIVRESSEVGVEAVYAGPGDGWLGWEASLALEALRTWVHGETGQKMNAGMRLTDSTRMVIVEATPMPDTPRGLMAKAVMESEEYRAGVPADDEGERSRLALVTSVDPPVTELWDSRRQCGCGGQHDVCPAEQ